MLLTPPFLQIFDSYVSVWSRPKITIRTVRSPDTSNKVKKKLNKSDIKSKQLLLIAPYHWNTLTINCYLFVVRKFVIFVCDKNSIIILFVARELLNLSGCNALSQYNIWLNIDISQMCFNMQRVLFGNVQYIYKCSRLLNSWLLNYVTLRCVFECNRLIWIHRHVCDQPTNVCDHEIRKLSRKTVKTIKHSNTER